MTGNADHNSMTRPEQLAKMRLFRKLVIKWGEKLLRQYFWRTSNLEPFELLVTEVLLARTRADSVEPVARRFLAEFPDPISLSKADIESVEEILYPLGLHRKRAKALVQMGEALTNDHDGHVPKNIDLLISLPYVGRYAANAVLCFAFGRKRPIVDANVARLLERYFGLDPPVGKLDKNDEYWEFARTLLPTSKVQVYNWALLDIGGLVCRKRGPACSDCLLRDDCTAHNDGKCGCQRPS